MNTFAVKYEGEMSGRDKAIKVTCPPGKGDDKRKSGKQRDLNDVR